MGRSTRVRVLIADDNRIYRRGIRARLSDITGIQVVGEVTTGQDAVTAAIAEKVDVVLMDLQMPGGTGIEAARALAQTPGARGDGTQVAVIMLTAHSDDRHVVEAIDSGAVGYLLKDVETRELVATIFAAAAGGAHIMTSVTRPVLQEFARRRDLTMPGSASPSLLTAAELSVVRKLCSGLTTNELIASALGVTANTVRTHIAAALAKTGSRDRTALALWALRHGLAETVPHPNG